MAEKEINFAGLIPAVQKLIPDVIVVVEDIKVIIELLKDKPELREKLGDGKILAMLAKLLPGLLQILPLFMAPSAK